MRDPSDEASLMTTSHHVAYYTHDKGAGQVHRHSHLSKPIYSQTSAL